MFVHGVTWEDISTGEFDTRFPGGVWSPVVAVGVHEHPLGFAGVGATRYVLGLWDGGDHGFVVTSQEIDAERVAVAVVDGPAAAFRLWAVIVGRDGVTVESHTHGLHA